MFRSGSRYFRHSSVSSPFLPYLFSKLFDYPAGSGKARIRRSMLPNRRRVRCAIRGIDLASGQVQTLPISKYIYTDIPGTDARTVRFRIVDGRQETILDVNSQDHYNLAEPEDLQFSIAPDDSVILHRQLHSPEIFAYDIREH